MIFLKTFAFWIIFINTVVTKLIKKTVPFIVAVLIDYRIIYRTISLYIITDQTSSIRAKINTASSGKDLETSKLDKYLDVYCE